jgi:hypothetical protein
VSYSGDLRGDFDSWAAAHRTDADFFSRSGQASRAVTGMIAIPLRFERTSKR